MTEHGQRPSAALVWAFAIGAAIAARADTPYAWPLGLPKVVTSSFAEYRVGRFHSGLDLRTGPIGQDVHAAEDGFVSRVRCSPRGYGKAIYVRLHDGHTVVYAHLDAFAGPVADYLRHAQHDRRSYTVDLYPDTGQFPVTRGQVIAKSGQTGVGVPHLHYEIRDPDGRPCNPRSLDLAWPDATRPVIRKVLIVPAGPSASLDGDIVPLIRQVRATGPGQYTCEPVAAAGDIGFGLDVIDPANNGGTKLGVYAVSTTVGDTPVFRLQNDRLAYDTTHNAVVCYHPFFLDEGRFLLQWRWPDNCAEPFQQTPATGWYTVPDDPGEVRIQAEDFFGNTAAVTIPLRPATPTPEPPAHGGGGAGRFDIECLGNWVVLTARFSAPETETPRLVVSGPAAAEGGQFRRIDARTFRAGYRPPAGTREVAFSVQHDRIPPTEHRLLIFQRGAGARTATLGDVQLHVADDSPYGTLFVAARPPDGQVVSRISVRGNPYRIWPDAAPINAPIELSFPVPDGVEELRRVHVYRKETRGWSCQTTRRADGRLAMDTRRLGLFVTMEDDRLPRITNVVPADGARLATTRPRIRATVADVGSGIEDVSVTCNGQWLLMDYDPERGQISWARDEDLPADPKELLFTATDRAGNTTTLRRIITGP